jgi:hypothetical protein
MKAGVCNRVIYNLGSPTRTGPELRLTPPPVTRVGSVLCNARDDDDAGDVGAEVR